MLHRYVIDNIMKAQISDINDHVRMGQTPRAVSIKENILYQILAAVYKLFIAIAGRSHVGVTNVQLYHCADN